VSGGEALVAAVGADGDLSGGTAVMPGSHMGWPTLIHEIRENLVTLLTRPETEAEREYHGACSAWTA
jgi:hypothetical protein